MAPLIIELAGRPRGKKRPRVTGRGTFTPKQTTRFERDLGWEATLAMRVARWRMIEKDVPVRLLAEAHFAVPDSWSQIDQSQALAGLILPVSAAISDWDNIGKITDALNKIVWHDDRQVVDARVCKFYAEEEFLRVTVWRHLDG